jgi:hypothetical protein
LEWCLERVLVSGMFPAEISAECLDFGIILAVVCCAVSSSKLGGYFV